MRALNLLVALKRSYAFDRNAFMGVATASQAHGEIFLHPYDPSGPVSLNDAAAGTNAKGLIVSNSQPEEIERVARLRLPCVNVANAITEHARVPVVGNDDDAIGEVVARYYLDRDFKHFACVTDPDIAYFFPRRDAFVRTIARAGFDCPVGPPPDRRPGRYMESLSKWISTLPRPLGVMCPYDSYAVWTVHACRALDLRVPEQVSIIGVDDDPLLCMSTSPQISSVKTAAREIGSAALELVLEMIAGRAAPARPILFPPTGIVTRGSTIERAIYDADVAAAVSFIRTRFRERLNVEGIAEHVSLSRRSLERKFLAVLGRTPHDEISRARLAHAKKLLSETDLPFQEVARRSGLTRVQWLSHVLKQETGLTPMQFRSSRSGS
jgi:LacI family transcriptional regulator